MDTKKIHLDKSGKMVEGISPTIQPFEIARFDRYDRQADALDQADVAAESLSEEAEYDGGHGESGTYPSGE